MGISEFQYYLFLYQLLLYRLSGQDDIVIGYPVSGRHQIQHENIIGNLINVIPFRSLLNEEMTLEQFILENKKNILSDWEHQQLAFDKILSASKHVRSPQHHPLFQHLFVHQNTPFIVDVFEQGNIKPYYYPLESAKFEICLSAISMSNGELHFNLEFNTQLFHEISAKSFLKAFIRLVKSSTEHLQVTLGDLKLTEEILPDLLTKKTINSTEDVITLFKQIANKQPDAIALQFENQQMSFQALNLLSDQLAQTLLEYGVAAGDLIGIALDKSIDLVPLIFAILKLRAAYLPLDLYSPQERLQLIIEDAKPKYIISPIDTLMNFTHTRQINFNELKKSRSNQTFIPIDILHSDLAYVIYTSGSTGTPNGVPIHHANLSRLFSSTDDFFNFNNHDTWILFHSHAFDFSVWEIWGALLHGSKLIIIPNSIAQNPEAFSKIIINEKVTVLNQTPSAFNAVKRNLLNQSLSLRYIILAGETLEVAGLTDWFDTNPSSEIINAYGITETTVLVTLRKIRAHDAIHGSRSPIGLPMIDLQVFILDKNLYPLPHGFPGELCVLGPGLSKGYLNNPTLSKMRFPFVDAIGENIYRSGDLARLLPNNELEYIGRIDKQIKLRGFRIELGEIENALVNIPEINEAAVIYQDSAQVLSAYIVLKNATGLTDQYIRSALLLRLPPYMIPTHYIFLPSIPININGKIDRIKLTTLTTAKAFEHSSQSYHSPIEKIILDIIQSLVQKPILADDHFFEIGAHSLLLANAHQLLKDKLQKDFPLTVFFDYPNVRKLAAHLESNTLVNTVMTKSIKQEKEPIAVIGMACRFPEANTCDEFWNNIYQGKESVKALFNSSIAKNSYNPDARYIPFTAWIEDIDQFDANFFGISAKEAELMDPQQRLLLEIAYHALEDAGYSDTRFEQNIGVFTSSSLSRYLLYHLLNNQPFRESAHPLQILLGNDKDFVANRLAYKLNCQGPAINIQTACSSSLVSIHEAIQSLRHDECDMAIAGGISINPSLEGYFYEEGGIGSNDGHCRPFDHKASGTVSGNGGGIVVLKKLSQAIADNDRIYAIVKGTAINNDGLDKVGFVAPSSKGQASVIEQALQDSGREAKDITFIETHGTATALGDAIEIQALDAIYGQTGKIKYLASTKANIGHLDTAAGGASFIKTVLAIKNHCIPPQINFEKFHPNFQYAKEFAITTKPLKWKITDNEQRIAAVSSFGLGGTNAHVILEEYKDDRLSLDTDRSYEICLATKFATDLPIYANTLAQFLRRHPEISLSDVEYTLMISRSHYAHRFLIIGENREILIEALSNLPTSSRNLSTWETGQDYKRERLKDINRKIISLPAYVFNKQKYWINASNSDTHTRRQPSLYAPHWKKLPHSISTHPTICFDLVFIHKNFELSLIPNHGNAIKVYPSDSYQKINHMEFQINPLDRNHFLAMYADIKKAKYSISNLLYAWSYADISEADYRFYETYCLLAPTLLIQTGIESALIHHPLSIKILRNRYAKVLGSDVIHAEASLLDGLIHTVPQELPFIEMTALDLPVHHVGIDIKLIQYWLNGNLEFHGPTMNSLALRDGTFWLQDWQFYTPSSQPDKAILPGSIVVISGGRGGIASILAPHLVQKYHCKVICLTRTPTPIQSDSIHYLACDISDETEVANSFATIIQKWGKPTVIFHLAGKAAEKLFIRKDINNIREGLNVKVFGSIYLKKMAQLYSIPKMILFSSASAILGGIGELEYCAANRYLDNMAVANDSDHT